jgi:hypothetical protein
MLAITLLFIFSSDFVVGRRPKGSRFIRAVKDSGRVFTIIIPSARDVKDIVKQSVSLTGGIFTAILCGEAVLVHDFKLAQDRAAAMLFVDYILS